MGKILFREEQRFTQWWLWLILGFVLIAIVIPFIIGLSAQTWNISSENFSRLVLNGTVLVFFVFIILTVLSLRRLETRITQDEINIRFPPFKRKYHRIKIDEIERFEIRMYKPFREYGGYGFRSRRKKGQAYIISGKTGLQLYLRNGKKLLIGTHKKQAIEYAMCKIMEKNKKLQQARVNAGRIKIGEKLKSY